MNPCPRRLRLVLLSMLGLSVHALALDAWQEQHVFRSTTAVVSVDVSVRAGNLLVAGLTAADFKLTDQGVLQEIQGVDTSAVPLDVSLVVDVNARPDWFERFRSDVAAIAAMLGPEDRLQIISYGYDVAEVLPLQAVPPVRSAGRAA